MSADLTSLVVRSPKQNFWGCPKCGFCLFRLHASMMVECGNCLATIENLAVVDRDEHSAPSAEVVALNPNRLSDLQTPVPHTSEDD